MNSASPDLVNWWMADVTSFVTMFGFFLLWILVLRLAKRIVFRRLKSWAAKTRFVWDDLLIVSLEFPINFIILASGLAFFAKFLSLPPAVDALAEVAFKGSVVFSIVLFADNLARNFSKVNDSSRRTWFSVMSSGVIRGLLRGFIIGLGALIFLQLMGISITPILASLGIGSLAVALALQDTLSNFFSGIYVSIDKPVQAGDFVRLESGQEGTVTDIGWRCTRIRTASNNIVIIPNTKLVGSVLTNYCLPNPEVVVTVEISVSYGSDLGRVEEVTKEVASAVMKTLPKEPFKDFKPLVHFHTFGDSAVLGTVTLRADEFERTPQIKHEFIKAIHRRFRKEGITIPFPVRTLDFSGTKKSLPDEILKNDF